MSHFEVGKNYIFRPAGQDHWILPSERECYFKIVARTRHSTHTVMDATHLTVERRFSDGSTEWGSGLLIYHAASTTLGMMYEPEHILWSLQPTAGGTPRYGRLLARNPVSACDVCYRSECEIHEYDVGGETHTACYPCMARMMIGKFPVGPDLQHTIDGFVGEFHGAGVQFTLLVV